MQNVSTRLCVVLVSAVLAACAQPGRPARDEPDRIDTMQPTQSGYAEASEGLKVYYEVHGKGEPIVILAGG